MVSLRQMFLLLAALLSLSTNLTWCIEQDGSDAQTKTTTTTTTETKTSQKTSTSNGCQYEKGQWQECTEDGFQIKIQRLKESAAKQKLPCELTKTIRRDCKPVGCKYTRGQWSGTCENGLRVRVDRLVLLNDNKLEPRQQQQQQMACKPQRRVTKDCHQTCHYVKSAWSECSPTSRVQTRNLTLAPSSDDSGQPQESKKQRKKKRKKTELVTSIAAIGHNCATFKKVKRSCRVSSSSPSSLGGLTSSGSTVAIQRRRLKQLQRRHERLKQKQQAPLNSSSLPSSAAGTATTTTTTTTTSNKLPVAGQSFKS